MYLHSNQENILGIILAPENNSKFSDFYSWVREWLSGREHVTRLQTLEFESQLEPSSCPWQHT